MSDKYQESVQIQRLRWEDHHQFAHAAYVAAEKHLEAIRRLAGGYNPNDGPELYSRLRAFFWEMMSAYDLFHVWANTHYQLGIMGRKLTPESVQKAMKDKPQCARSYEVLRDAEASPWLFEVRTYRNYAHRSFLDVNAMLIERDNSSMVFLVPAREGQNQHGMTQMHDQLQVYLDAMFGVGVHLDAIKRGVPL